MLGRVFASEKSHKTEDLILSSKEGKKTVIYTKIISGEIFSLLIGATLLISIQLPNVIFNGFRGFNTACQIILPFSSYTYTSGKLIIMCLCVYLFACFLIGAIAMLLSCILNNVIATAGIICVGAGVDLFVSLPPKYRIASQIRYLTPIQLLNNLADPRLLRIGKAFLNSYHLVGMLYIFYQ